jgi:hypothetical protein
MCYSNFIVSLPEVPQEVKAMSSISWMYSMTSFVTISIALIVVVAFGYTTAVSNKQTHGHHLVDTMAGDEGED